MDDWGDGFIWGFPIGLIFVWIVTFENLRVAGKLVMEGNATDYVEQRGKTSGFHFVPPKE